MASAAPERVSMDPYFHWLGVTTPNRPPNAYELLGLTMFETSLARIQAAATRKRADLAQHREAVDPELWETVRQQLESAIDTLVDTTAKSILDASLRRRRWRIECLPTTNRRWRHHLPAGTPRRRAAA